MKIEKCSLKNFCSYPTLDFDFQDLGLSLISGETGSGKSTFLDAVSWTLFGVTSKEGASDDVKAWDGNGSTEGKVRVVLPTGTLEVCRVRGSGKNDLYWYEEHLSDGKEHRGKDLTDTQRLLEKRLGVSADLFLIGGYLTQFSKADSFFIAKAKDRRDVLEKIADQEFAITLGEKSSEARKVAKKDKEALDLELSKAVGRRDTLSEAIPALAYQAAGWDEDKTRRLNRIQDSLQSFQSLSDGEAQRLAKQANDLNEDILEETSFDTTDLKAKIAELSKFKTESQDLSRFIASHQADIRSLDRESEGLKKADSCPTCLRPIEKGDCSSRLDQIKDLRLSLVTVLAPKDKKYKTLQDILKQEEPLRKQLEGINLHKSANDMLVQKFDALMDKLKMTQETKNPYGAQFASVRAEVNPFHVQQDKASADLKTAETRCHSLETQVEAKGALVASLTWLYDKSFELRGLLMTRVVSQIESATNSYLEKYFDAALRVQFSLADSDKLEVEINNNGFPCPFKSLSGGERTMLKLAFSLSLMRAAQDKAGVTFDMIMLDEPFGGLSDDLKVKAFGLLQELETEYGTVLVIDHSSEMKTQFHRTFLVDKNSCGHSEVHEQQNQ